MKVANRNIYFFVHLWKKSLGRNNLTTLLCADSDCKVLTQQGTVPCWAIGCCYLLQNISHFFNDESCLQMLSVHYSYQWTHQLPYNCNGATSYFLFGESLILFFLLSSTLRFSLSGDRVFLVNKRKFIIQWNSLCAVGDWRILINS